MKELLVPVGNMDSLIVAIKSGADAVYLAGKKYGARASAVNFSDEEMIEAVKLCHLYGVKIYVTVNTLIYESEFPLVIDYVRFLYKIGVDALIVQDIGLISYLRRNYPDLYIHASTQVHSTNERTLKLLSGLGVKRVVLARELSIEEINGFSTELELEAFIHGALCVSYSGQCLFSSRILNRSGNRGECAQMCRLPYLLYCENEKLETKGQYLLSPKELNTMPSFKQIMDSNIYSLKIEGRMKSPEYVGCVTKLYRSLIDSYEKFGECFVDQEILEDISIIFNRNFTTGFLFNQSLDEVMNIKSSNHQGVFIGKVVDIRKKYIYVKLEKDLKQGDGIRFLKSNEGMICNYIYDTHGKLINGGKEGDTILLDNRFNTEIGDSINKTFSVDIKNKYLDVQYPKMDISMKFIAKVSKPLYLCIKYESNLVEVTYDGVVELATNVPTTKERIEEQLLKLGNTPFKCDNLTIDIENNLFISIKDLNELRRMAVNKLIMLRENSGFKDELSLEEVTSKYEAYYDEKMSVSILVRNEEQLKYLLDKEVRIYVLDRHLYDKYKDYENVFYRTNRVADDFSDKSLITELGSLNNGGFGDYFLNVTNHESINFFSKYVDVITLSCELEDSEIENIMNYYNGKVNVELFVYGRLELMLMKYCPLKYLVNKSEPYHICQNNKRYYLASNVNNDLKKYPLCTDVINHTTHILNHELVNKIESIPFYKKIGIRNFRIELFNENEEEINLILKLVKENLC